MRRPSVVSRMAVLVTAAVLLAAAGPVAAQPAGCPPDTRPVNIGPAWFDRIEGGGALGAEGALAWCSARYDPRPRLPRAGYVGIDAHGALPFDRLRLPQNLQASARGGLTLSLTERARDEGGDLDEQPGFLFDYGVLGLAFHARYESSTDYEEQAITGGGEIRWVHPKWPLAPSVVLTLEAVRPLVSELRDTIAAGNDLHGRMGVHLYWLVPVRTWLEAEVDGRWFDGFGMDPTIADSGLGDGAFIDARASLVLQRPIGPVRLDRLFVGYSHGRQPTDDERRKAWTVGARLTARDGG